MAIEIKEVTSAKDHKDFVNVQFDIYKNNKFWVPPLKKDEIKALKTEHNPAFRFCTAKFWNAYKDGKCVGRIGGIINNMYNEKTNSKVGRFTRTEFIDDSKVTKALFSTAEKWLKDQGMTEIQGPLGFTNLDHQGMLVEGFDHLPSAASEYHHAYYKTHLKKLGYEKEIDWIEFRLFLEGMPEKAKRGAQIVKKRSELSVKSFTKSSELQAYGPQLFEILNEAFKDLLDRGGVIAGSSAGASIQGSYLARGDTKRNTIMMGDYEIGLGFLSNVAIDQHLMARNRQFDMFEILENRPELLGIGLDENTGIIVNYDKFEVFGESYVAMYDGTRWSAERDTIYQLPKDSKEFYLLKSGDRYNLKKKAVITTKDK